MKYSAKLLIGAATCLVSLVSTAQAATPGYTYPTTWDGWYGGLSGDVTWLRHDETGGGGNGAIGYRMNDVRLEGEVGYHSAGSDNGYGGTHYITYMGNAYYDFNSLFPTSQNGWRIVPYVGGGLGDAQVHFGNGDLSSTFHHHDNDFAYQGMAGFTFVADAMPRVDWTVGYRYQGTDDTHSYNDLRSNNLEFGIRYHF